MDPFKPLIAVWAVGTLVLFIVVASAFDIRGLGYGLWARGLAFHYGCGSYGPEKKRISSRLSRLSEKG